jgi:hypothetical protein
MERSTTHHVSHRRETAWCCELDGRSNGVTDSQAEQGTFGGVEEADCVFWLPLINRDLLVD